LGPLKGGPLFVGASDRFGIPLLYSLPGALMDLDFRKVLPLLPEPEFPQPAVRAVAARLDAKETTKNPLHLDRRREAVRREAAQTPADAGTADARNVLGYESHKPRNPVRASG
jgi:hypothetical protein